MVINTISKGYISYLRTDTRYCIQPNLEHPSIISHLREEFEKDFISRGFVYCGKKYGDMGLKYKLYSMSRKIKHKIFG